MGVFNVVFGFPLAAVGDLDVEATLPGIAAAFPVVFDALGTVFRAVGGFNGEFALLEDLVNDPDLVEDAAGRVC